MQRGTPVVVIGQDVADHFFPEPRSDRPRAHGFSDIPYTVVGVPEKQGSVFGLSLDKFIVAPDKSPLNRCVNPHGVIDAMMIQAPSREAMRERDGDACAQVMRARHHLRPSQQDNFELETSDSALEFWNKIKRLPRDRRHRAARDRARRRRDRDHEHHARRGRRAHARDRHPQVARRAPAATS